MAARMTRERITRGANSVETTIPLCCNKWTSLIGTAIAKYSARTASAAKQKAVGLVFIEAKASISAAVAGSTCPLSCRKKEVKNVSIGKPQGTAIKDCKGNYTAIAMASWRASIRCVPGTDSPGIIDVIVGGGTGVAGLRYKKLLKVRLK